MGSEEKDDADVEEHALQEPGGASRAGEPDRQSDEREPHAVAHHHREKAKGLRLT